MKVIFDVGHPFAWADGGASVLCERVMQGLRARGVEVEPLRWWDRKQSGDLLQTFRVPDNVTRFAAVKGLKIFAYVFLDGITSASWWSVMARAARNRIARTAFPAIADQLGYRMAEFVSGFVVPSAAEIPYLHALYGVDFSRTRAILHGVDSVYKRTRWTGGGDYLISIGTICRRKNSLVLAKLANDLQIPIKFVGNVQDVDSEYGTAFRGEAEGRFVEHHPGLGEDEKIALMQAARGYVLLSNGESGSIATLEAFAMGMPVILPAYAWATGIYSGHAQFVSMRNAATTAYDLKTSYWNIKASSTFPVDTWDEVAGRYLTFYASAVP